MIVWVCVWAGRGEGGMFVCVCVCVCVCACACVCMCVSVCSAQNSHPSDCPGQVDFRSDN